MNNIAHTLIDIFIILLSSIGLLETVGLLILICYHRRQHPINTAVLLICSTYLAILLSCLTILDMYTYNLYGDTHETVSFNNWWCYGRAYILHVGLASIYYSYLLQSIYRLFRIVFFKYRRLQNFRFMFRLVLIQWCFTFLLLVPALVWHQFEYVPQYYYCQILLTNLPGTLIVTLSIYSTPVHITISIYAYIIYYIKHTTTSTIQQNRHRTNRRDIVVLRRIVGITGILIILLLPAIVLWLYYNITGYLNPITDRIQWLAISIALVILPFTTACSIPQLRQLLLKLWRPNRRIQPMIIVQPLPVVPNHTNTTQ